MTSSPVPDGGLTPLESLALSYQRGAAQDRLRLLLNLDRRLARTVLGAREQVLAQIKLAWWRDAMAGTNAQARADPLVAALLGGGLADRAVALVDGWEAVLVADGWDDALIGQIAGARALVIDPDRTNTSAAVRWAAWNLSLQIGEDGLSLELWRWAAEQDGGGRWPRDLRGSAILAGLAAAELRSSTEPRQPSGLGSWLRTVRLGLTGR